MYQLESVKTNHDDSTITAYRFSSPTGSQTFVLLSLTANAGIALSLDIEFRYSRAASTLFCPFFYA